VQLLDDNSAKTAKGVLQERRNQKTAGANPLLFASVRRVRARANLLVRPIFFAQESGRSRLP
jgi:hypothetical protein